MTKKTNAANKSATSKKASNQDGVLRCCVHSTMETFFTQLDGQPVTNLYDMVITEVEGPLLSEVMKYAKDNQSKASEILGLNRGTLRKKLKQHKLL